MGNSELDYQLYSLIKTFLEAAIFLYQIYRSYFKTAALLLLAYLCFKTGRATVADPIEQKVLKMQNILQNRAQYTIVLPKKIQTINTSKKILIGLLVISIVILVSLELIEHAIVKQVSLQNVLLGQGTLLALVLFLWLYEVILKFRLSKGSFNDHHINLKLQQICNMLGTKADQLLKLFLNKENIIKSQRKPTSGCIKQKCQDYRNLLKEKSQGISAIVEDTLMFEWCSVCKRRLIFDQFLSFQPNPYQKQDSNLDQEQDARQRNVYLMNEVERMTKWVKNIGPCNCSRRYWSDSTRAIVQFKNKQKQMDARLAMFEAKLPKNDTAYRLNR